MSATLSSFARRQNVNTKKSLDDLQLSDIYSLMFFILYRTQDLPEYATLSEICYLLDGSNLLRLITYFAGKTITIPSEEDLTTLVNALLMYQYINIEGLSFVDAQKKLQGDGPEKKFNMMELDKITQLYLKIIPIIKEYRIDRRQISGTRN